MRAVSATLLPTAIPFSTAKMICGVSLQSSVAGTQIAEDKPLPYSPLPENHPPRRSLTRKPLVTLQRCSWSAGVKIVGAPKHGANNCVSQPELSEIVWFTLA